MADGVVNVQVNAIGNFGNVIGEVGKLQSKLQSLKLPKNLGGDAAKGLSELQEKFANLQNLANKGIKTKADFNNFEKAAKEVDVVLKQVEKSLNGISNKKIKVNMTDNDEIKKKIQDLEKFKKEAADALNLKSLGTQNATGVFNIAEINKIKSTLNEGTAGAKNLQNVLNSFKSGNIDQASAAIQKLVSYAKQYEKTLNDSGGNTRGTELLAWATRVQAAISGADAKIDEFNADINRMRTDQFSKMASGVESLRAQFSGLHTSANQVSQEMRNMARSTMDTQSQLGNLQTQANYFFGLQNMFQLFKRNIQETFDTVKQLDAAMTETAVVTDYSVSDMWGKLPLYTKTANELGATIKGAYETMTLYYQQGLNTEEAFSVGTETMKMARIAGLDYAQTTNMMTAALRGFNMEINSTSAKRVNDVYSELAAVTASDTRELGLAMERTASIAHSANMDFGNTTAFLAQMIETTREAPENLGTAMKTIIARFQELKENPYQISEVEGEEVDFNRVDKALKTIGVDLMDNRDKFRDLDDVFMDISEKWDGLSQTQQRYIATIAAGARQQSRFLAMVGNYDRLKQLTDAAANSAGASDVQFAKTLDSMEAKLNRLRNAWDQFAMGIANNQLLKGAVDFGVKALDTVNKIENKIEELAGGFGTLGGSVAKSITSLTALWAAFKVGGKIVDTSIGLLGGFLGVTKVKGAGLLSGISGQRSAANIAQASAIYTPIVNAINNAAARISQTELKTSQAFKVNQTKGFADSWNTMRNAQKKFAAPNAPQNITTDKYDITGSRAFNKASNKQFDSSDILKNMSGLGAAQQRAIFLQSVGTQRALERSFQQATDKLNLSEVGQKTANAYYQALQNGIKNGTVTPEQAIRTAFNPHKLGQAIGGDVGKEISLKAIQQAQQYMREAKAKGITGKENRKAYVVNKFRDQQLTSLTDKEQKINKFTGITSGATAAGQAVMNLGMVLDNLGLHGAGSALTSIGSTLTSIGLAAAGAVDGVAALNKVLAGVGLSAGPVGLAIAGVAAAIGVAIYAAKKEKEAIAKVQKEGTKVVEDYDKTIERTTKNINKLTDESANFAVLSQGVDANGNNINLGSEEYADYLKIVNEVAKIHPELVKGYNAHGQAILKNNKAVEEAIDLEKKQQKQAEAEFTSVGSLDKLIASRETTKRWQVGQKQGKTVTAGRGIAHTTDSSKLEKDSQTVIDNIKKLDKGKEVLSQLEADFNLTTGALTNLTEEGIQAIQDHGDAMLSTVQGEYAGATDKTTQGIVESVQNSIAQVGKDTKGIEEVTEPIYRALSTYASRQGLFDNIPEEFREAAETGIKEVSKLSIDEKTGAKLSGADMQARVRAVTQAVENLNGHSDEYQQALSEMDQAQQQFGKDLDKEAYGEAITSNIGALMKWRDEALKIYKRTGDESQRIISETLQNQIEAYDNFATNGGKTLADGFNQHSAELEKAAQSYENFQSQTENINDYYTGSDNMKQIIDDIKDGVDDLGKGSQTFWKGAESLLGEDYIKGKSFDKVNQQVGALKDIFYDSGGQARDAEAQVGKFFDYLQERQADSVKGEGLSGTIADYMKVADGKFDFDKMANLSAEQFKDVATSLGMSETSLISLLNQARQFADIEFSNLDVLREGLATMDGTIAGNSKNKAGETSLYTRRSTFEAEAAAQGYTLNEVDDLAEEIKSKNVKLLADADEMGIKQLQSTVKDMGIQSGQDFIKNFSELGYGKGEIQTLYDKFMGSGKVDSDLQNKIDLKDATFGDAYNEALKDLDLELGQDANESTADNTAQIASTTSAILAAVGGLQVDDFDKNTTTKGANGKVYYEGKGYDALHEVYGGAKTDTMAQHFAKGEAKNGQTLSLQQYEENYNKLLQMRQNYDAKAAEMEIASQHASEEAEAVRFARQAEYYRQASTGLDGYIKKGEEFHQKYLADNEEEKNSDNDKTQNKTSNDQKETESSQTKTDNEKNNRQQLSDEYQQYLASLQDKIQPGEEQQTLLTPEQLAQKYGMLTPSDIENYKAKYQELQQLKSNLSPTESGNTEDIINNASNIDATIQKLQQTGQIGAQSADSIKRAFIDANINGIAKMDGSQLASLQSTLGVTKEELQQIATEHNITINTEDSTVDETEGKIEKLENHPPVKVPITIDGDEGGDKKPSIFSKIGEWAKEKFKVQTDDSELDSTQQKAETAANFINKGATFTISTPGASNLTKAANAAKKLANTKENKTINVKTGKVDTSSVKNAKSSIDGMTGKMKVSAEASDALKKAEAARKTIDSKSATINVSTSVTGQNVNIYITKHVKEVKSSTGGLIVPGGPIYRARGGLASNPMFKREGTDTIPAMLTPGEYVQNRDAVKYFGIDFMRRINHMDLPGALQSFGSVAKGSRYGTVGPKGKGGLTLTGEGGFEIAWLPSENRSMILGANGPQMVDLPSDAVIWDNKQSKKIIKQNSIPIGSMVRGSGDIPGGGNSNPGGGNNPGSGNGGNGGNGGNDDKGGTSPKKAKEYTRELQKQGKVNSYIFNLEQKIAQVKRKQEAAQKALNKQLEQAAATLKSVSNFGNQDIGRLKQLVALNKKLVSYYQKRLDKANANNKQSKRTIKWTVKTQKKKGKNGKWKQGKTKNKKASVNIGNYIDFDPVTGAYTVNYEKITNEIGKTHKIKKGKNKGKKVKGDKAKAKAVREAAEKAISENTSKRDSAQDAINDAQDKLEELGKQLYDTFFGWKNELTKIYVLSKQIEDSEKRINNLKEAQSLRDAMIASGLSKQLSETSQIFINSGMKLFEKQLSTTLKEIQQKSQAIKLQRQEISDLRTGSAIQETYKKVSTITNYSNLEDKRDAAQAQVNKDTAAIAAGNKVLKSGTTLGKEKKKVSDANSKIKKENKKIKKANKTIKSKKASKKQKEKAKKTKAKAKKRKNTQVKKKNTANQKIKKINAKTAAEKRKQADINKRDQAQKELNNAKTYLQSQGIDISKYTDTELIALKERKKELKDQQDIITKAKQFTTVSTNGDGTINIDFDTEGLERARDSGQITEEMYNGIKDYYDNLNESNETLQDLMQDQISLLSGLYEDLADLNDQYADHSEELLDATENVQEKEIDQLENLNKSLSDALKDLLDEVKNRLEERRQQEDNAKKEQDISQKQNRLAALRADSSGANAKEIKQLEKEIAEAQQSYGRELEDQQLQRLQDQADKAAEQRERQIQILSNQLEYDKSTGSNLEKVKALMEAARSDDESIRAAAKAEIEALWKSNKDYENSTDERKKVLDAEWETFWDNLTLLPQKIKATEKAIKENEEEQSFLGTILSGIEDLSLTLDAEELYQQIAKGEPWTTEQTNAVSLGVGIIVKKLEEEGKTNEQIAKILKDGGITDYDQAKGILSAKQAVDYGLTTFEELKNKYNFDITKLKKEAGASIQDLLGLGFEEKDVFAQDYSAKDFKEAGIGIDKLGQKFNATALKEGGYTVQDFKAANKSDQTIYETFSAKELKESGLYTASDLKNNNFSYNDVKGLWTDEELSKVGYSEATAAVNKKNNEKNYSDAVTKLKKNKKEGQVTNTDINNLFALGSKAGHGKATVLSNLVGKYNGLDPYSWKGLLKAVLDASGISRYNLVKTFPNDKNLAAAIRAKLKKGPNTVDEIKKDKKYKNAQALAFKTGGLANYTGPAWLDGTPSKPELVLNAQDTKNFMALRDVLDKAVGSANSVTNTNENAMYEININVDHINNDYDVDKIAARIKKDIIKDAGYRNVTQVRNFR